MRFMVDENLSPYLARALQGLFSADHEVEHIRNYFGPGTTDISWIEILSQQGEWIIISGDRRISKNKAELAAFRSSNLIGFFLCRTIIQKPVRQQLIRILTIWDQLETQARLVQPGAMFEIPERSVKFRSIG